MGVNGCHTPSATLVGVSVPDPEGGRRRRVALALAVLALALFVAELVALVLGAFEVAGVIVVAFFAAWFVLRSWQRREARRGAGG